MERTKTAGKAMIFISVLMGAMALLQSRLARSAYDQAEAIDRAVGAAVFGSGSTLLFGLGVILIAIANAAQYVRGDSAKAKPLE